MMVIQGNLQIVFDALFEMGIIDPVLKKDWKLALEAKPRYARSLSRAISIVNHFINDRNEMLAQLRQFDDSTLELLAIEVAREYADFHSREQLH